MIAKPYCSNKVGRYSPTFQMCACAFTFFKTNSSLWPLTIRVMKWCVRVTSGGSLRIVRKAAIVLLTSFLVSTDVCVYLNVCMCERARKSGVREPSILLHLVRSTTARNNDLNFPTT